MRVLAICQQLFRFLVPHNLAAVLGNDVTTLDRRRGEQAPASIGDLRLLDTQHTSPGEKSVNQARAVTFSPPFFQDAKTSQVPTAKAPIELGIRL